MNGSDGLFFKLLTGHGFVNEQKLAKILKLANQSSLGGTGKKVHAVAFVLEWLESKERLSQEIILKRISDWIEIPFVSECGLDVVNPYQVKYIGLYNVALRDYCIKFECIESRRRWLLLLNPWVKWNVIDFEKSYSALLTTTHEIKRWLELFHSKREGFKKQTPVHAPFQALQQPIRKDIIEDSNTRKSEKNEVTLNSCIDRFLEKAIRMRSSDIHFEALDEGMRIRYRMDGVFVVEEKLLPQRIVDTAVNQLKIMGAMNVAEKRVPQEGSGTYTLDGKIIALRYSCIPGIKGESIVVRCMRDSDQLICIKELGMNECYIKKIMSVLQSAQGLVLVVGPTGSGKTTSLYAMLQILSRMGKKIVSIEDPIEVLIPGVNQVQVDECNGITFETALKSFLRQSPEVIMIGEIRDPQTAHIAIQASFTGHLVLGTLHTEDTLTAIARLIDLGVDARLLSNALQFVIAQRLIRKTCRSCNAIAEKQCACKQCSARGFQGRVGIFEMLQMDYNLRESIRKSTSLHFLRKKMEEVNFVSLWQEGLSKVKSGITTVEELQRCIRKN